MPVAAPAKQLQAALLLQNEGLALSKSATYTIGIAAGRCVVADASGNRDVAILSSSITKVLNSAWASGSGNGMLDSGSVSNTWYHCYLIYNQSTGAVDAIASLSFSAPALSSGFTFYNYLGSVWVQSAAIVDFDQYAGGVFVWRDEKRDVDNVAVPTTATLYTVSCPPNIPCEVKGLLTAGAPSVSSSVGIYVSGPDQTDFTPTNADPRAGNYNVHASGLNNGTYEVLGTAEIQRTTSTGQLRFRRVGSYLGSSNQTTWRTNGYRNLRLAAIAGSSSGGGTGITSVVFASLGSASSAGDGAFRYISDYNITVVSDGSVWRPLGVQCLNSQTVTQSITGSTTETTLYTFTVPGGLLHANAVLRLTYLYGATSNTNTKTIRVKIGATTVNSGSYTNNSLSGMVIKTIAFKNSLSSQETHAGSPLSSVAFGANSSSPVISAIDFSSNQAILVTLQLGVGTDTANIYHAFLEWVN